MWQKWQPQANLRDLKEPRVVMNHSVAPSPQHQAVWRDMKEPTAVINHSVTPSVITNILFQAIWRDMKEPTLVINHSAVPSVTKMVSLMMARDMKEPRAVKNHSVAPVWLQMFTIKPQRDMKEPALVILTWWKKFQEWKHLVGSPSYGLSGQWDIINKQNLRHLSCFFRLNCH